MVNDALENDPDYVKAAKQAKQAAEQKSSAKKTVISQPEIAKIHDKLQDGTKQLKEMRAAPPSIYKTTLNYLVVPSSRMTKAKSEKSST